VGKKAIKTGSICGASSPVSAFFEAILSSGGSLLLQIKPIPAKLVLAEERIFFPTKKYRC